MCRSSSICPLPSTPATPRISPPRTSKLKEPNPGPVRSLTDKRTPPGVRGTGLCARVRSRPTIISASRARLAPATGARPDTRPSRNTTTSSQISKTSGNLWVMKMMPFPSARRRRRIVSRSATSVGARLEVGSSRIRSSASRRIALRISTRCRRPSGSVATSAAGSRWRPKRRLASRTCAAMAAVLITRPACWPAEHHVLHHRHRLDQHEVLVNHRDAGRHRLAGMVTGKFSAAEDDSAGIGRQHSEKHFHQRAFARTVLAEQTEDLTRLHVEIDAVVGPQCAERAHHAAHFQERSHGLGRIGRDMNLRARRCPQIYAICRAGRCVSLLRPALCALRRSRHGSRRGAALQSARSAARSPSLRYGHHFPSGRSSSHPRRTVPPDR